MGVFYRRPLALFSFIFLMSALFAYGISDLPKILGVVAVLATVAVMAVLSIILKKARMKLLVASVCISAIAFSLLQSFIFISMPANEAKEYEGENTALCYIIDQEDEGQYGKKYNVKVKRIGDDSVSIKALLICGFDVDLKGGDEIYGYAEIDGGSTDDPEQLLTLYMSDAGKSYARYTSQGKGIIEILFSKCGVEILSCRLSNAIKTRLYSALGERNGSLAMGFFTGDRSDIPADIARDFRRAGVSHLMAVSGSHIAILLGGIELILKRLGLHKNIRCVLITVCGLGFLFITGFSLSACRSVFMLYAVYISYFLRESGDPITSLFVSIACIVLIFPYSIADLGLWMSCLATLGLLTVYPLIEEKIPYPRKMLKPVRFILKSARELLLIAIMTLISNMFLLPIIWYYFGEISLVAVVSNILVTSLSSLFLLSVPVLLLIASVPLLGAATRGIVSFLAEAIIYIVNLCSKIPNATISLKYGFCAFIVILFAISLSILLIVRLKKKLLVLLPYSFAITSFVVCFAIHGVFSSPTVTYSNYGKGEMLVVKDNVSLSICDRTNGGYRAYSEALRQMENSYATDIDNYIYLSYDDGNLTSLELLADEIIISTIYLPTPEGDLEILSAKEMHDLAREKGIDVVFYGNAEVIRLSYNAAVSIGGDPDKEGYLCFSGRKNNIVYATPEYCSADMKYDILIVGDSRKEGESYNIEKTDAGELYISSVGLAERLKLPDISSVFIPKSESYKVDFSLK